MLQFLSLLWVFGEIEWSFAATAITEANSNPFRPGNQNVDPDGLEVEKTFPAINVHYEFSPSDLDISGFMKTARFVNSLDRRAKLQQREIRRDSLEFRRLLAGFRKAQRRSGSSGSSFVQSNPGLDPALYPEAPEYPVINIAIEEPEFPGKQFIPADELKRLKRLEKQHLKDVEQAIELAEILAEQLTVLAMMVLRRGGPVREPSSFAEVEIAASEASPAINAVMQADPLLKAKVVILVSRIPSGGLTAAQAIAGLYNLVDEPGIKELMKQLQVPTMLKTLNLKPKTPELVRWQAGSLMSRLTGIPSVENQAELAKGTNALVTVVLPRPSHAYSGDKRLAKVSKQKADSKAGNAQPVHTSIVAGTSVSDSTTR